MSESNIDHASTRAAGRQPSYKPPYQTEPRPQPQPLHYPGMHYQLYPAALDPGTQRQPTPQDRLHKHSMLQGLWLLVSLAAVALGLSLLVPDMIVGHPAQRSFLPEPTPPKPTLLQSTLQASLVDSSDPLDDPPFTLPSTVAMERMAPSVPPSSGKEKLVAMATSAPVSSGLNMPDKPVVPAAPPARTQLDVPDKSPSPAALPANVALNIPDVPAAAQRANAVGDDNGAVVKTQSAPTSGGCMEALRAMQLCGEQAR